MATLCEVDEWPSVYAAAARLEHEPAGVPAASLARLIRSYMLLRSGQSRLLCGVVCDLSTVVFGIVVILCVDYV